MREYLPSVAGVDRNVGRLLNLLDKEGWTESTVVIFTSDHGYNIGHHGIQRKGNGSWLTLKETEPYGYRPNMFDSSLRVPAIVRWPDVVKPGSRVGNTVTNLDWFPTLLAIAGVELLDEVLLHGRNFLPLLKGERISWDEGFYSEYNMHHFVVADMRVIRTPEWKLMRDFKRQDKDELYHLYEDPGETENLINNPAYAAQLSHLNRKLDVHHARLETRGRDDL